MAAGKGDSTSSSADTGGNESPNRIRSPLLPNPKHHPFWETQPVKQFADAGDLSFPEGPIAPQIPSSDLPENPYNLPTQFEWKAIDIDDDDPTFSDLHQFISKNYADNISKKIHLLSYLFSASSYLICGIFLFSGYCFLSVITGFSAGCSTVVILRAARANRETKMEVPEEEKQVKPLILF